MSWPSSSGIAAAACRRSGLNQAVRRFDTGKNSSANTNLLYQGPDEEDLYPAPEGRGPGHRLVCPGVMEGGRRVVDKPICRDCIQWVRLAAPDVIRDSHEGSDEEREQWARWTNPFDLTPKKRPSFL